MNISGVFQREKRHPNQMYHPMHHSVANYWTEALQKREMKHNFTDELFLTNIHMIPDPLKKNLADSLFNMESGKTPEKMYKQSENLEQSVPKAPKQTTLGGIGSFFSGVMNVLTNVMFRSRETNYYDCFDVDSQAQAWQQAKADVQDKNGQTSGRRNNDAAANTNASPEMNLDSRQAVTGCERKLNEVLHLLTPKQTSSPVWVRKRPKKVFVESGSVEENFQDAFSPEDFCSLQNDSFIEYYSPMQYQCEELCETAAQKTKLNMASVEKSEIIKDVSKPVLEDKKDATKQNNNELEQKMQLEKDFVPKENNNMPTHEQKMPDKAILNMEHQEMENKTEETEKSVPDSPSIKNQLVSSCEDKLSRLKALLQEKRLKCRTSLKCEPEYKTLPKLEAKETKTADKRFKNPNRRCAKRTKSKNKSRIEDDLIFANEISIGTPPSVENSPMQHTVSFGDYFDEVSGRFRTTSTGSDDSFQIVFNEYPTGRLRKSSDCDSEDSFIVFEDSPDNCFVSNDVFDSDSESEMSDSGFDVTFQLAHSLTRTVSNLADDSLYVGEDEVDCAMVSPGANVTVKPFETPEVLVTKTPEDSEKNTGLLLDAKKKLLRKNQPSKQVRFSSDAPKVHVMRVWAFAARQARAGHWERFAVDRERFKRRIADADMALSWVLKPQHRSRVMFQRFMPWWNQLKRKELAERRAKEEEEKRRAEEEKQKAEEEKQKAEEDRRKEEDENRREKEEKQREEVESVQEKQKQEDTKLQKQDHEDSKSANNVNFKQQCNVSEQINAKSNLGDLNNKIGSGKDNLQELKDIPLEGNQEIISQSIIESKSNIRPKDKEVVNSQNGSVQVTVTQDSNNIFLIKENGKISNLIMDDALAKKIQDLEADDSSRNLISS